MGYLSTHVLDLVAGRPAVGMALSVSAIIDGRAELLVEAVTNHDGRVDQPLLEGDAFSPGVYQIEFHVGPYFVGPHFKAGAAGSVPFLDIVPLRFGVDDASGHYHVPLLVTPWSYSTYRGS